MRLFRAWYEDYLWIIRGSSVAHLWIICRLSGDVEHCGSPAEHPHQVDLVDHLWIICGSSESSICDSSVDHRRVLCGSPVAHLWIIGGPSVDCLKMWITCRSFLEHQDHATLVSHLWIICGSFEAASSPSIALRHSANLRIYPIGALLGVWPAPVFPLLLTRVWPI